jgi:glycosyltransferase involved in cell wall biosynthesis
VTPRNDARHALIVVGMHRSGTSALAGVLARLGARMPANPIPANADNLRGYYESRAITQLHDDLFAEIGSHWSDWTPLELEALPADVLGRFSDRLKGLLVAEYGEAELILVKDPRLCRLMPLWSTVLDDLAIHPQIVLPIREPAEVVASLVARERDWVSPVEAPLIWLRYVLDAEKHTRDLPRAFVSYADLLDDWRALVDHLSTRLEVTWLRDPDEVTGDVESFLSDDLRHQAGAPLLSEGQLGTDWVARAATSLGGLMRWDTDTARADLNDVRAEFDAMAVTSGPLLRDVASSYRVELARRSKQLESLRSAEIEAESRLAATESQLAATESHLAAEESRSATLAHQCERAEATADKLSRQHDRLRTSLDEMRSEARRQDSRSTELEDCLRDRFTEVAHLSGRTLELERQAASFRDAQCEAHLRTIALRQKLDAATQLLVNLRADSLRRRPLFERLRRARGLPSGVPDLDVPTCPEEDVQLLEESALFDADWYQETHPEVARSGLSPAWHYLLHGAAAQFDPGPTVSTAGYLARNPDVAASGMNPLVHYLRHGRAEGRPLVLADDDGGRDVIEQSNLFDAAWYDRQYPDARMTSLSPAEHYLTIGARLHRDPGPGFSTAHYLHANPDVAQRGVNPLWHYERHGRSEGRSILPSGSHRPLALPDRPIPRLAAPAPVEHPARVIAFYLPQFHTIPENDEWWGEGFTEWANVRSAQPWLAGHYQPHVPGELGYYDLRDPEVQRRQVELARLYGIYGFCFYFYWFAGKRLLETPLRNYLRDPSLDLPFMLCWANENWSRRWDGRDDDVLIAQDHSTEDDLAFIEHVAGYLRDPRYIRVGGKPVLVVYRPTLLPDPKATVASWRTWCRDKGVGEIYLACTQSFESVDPRDYDFDAAIEFPPNNSGIPDVTRLVRPDPGFGGRICDWSPLIERSERYAKPTYRLHRGVCPSWDNTPRRGAKGTVLVNSTPGRFARWATNAIRDTGDRFESPDERLVFVNAWNEWAEGTHLEPDLVYGYAWLESIRVALARNTQPAPLDGNGPRLLLLIDATRSDDLRTVLGRCQGIPGPVSMLVTTTPPHQESVRHQLDAAAARADLVVADGTEPSLLLAARRVILAAEVDIVVAVAPDLVDVLEPDFLDQALLDLATDPRVGIVLPTSERVENPTVDPRVHHVGDRLGLNFDEITRAACWRGSSFVARAATLAPVVSLAFDEALFDRSAATFEAGLAGAIDRAGPLGAVAIDLRLKTTGPSSSGDRRSVVIVSHDAHPHGAQRLALNIARGYRALGLDVHLVLLGPGSLLGAFRDVATVYEVDLDTDSPARVRRLVDTLVSAGATFAVVNTTASGRILPALREAGLPTVSLIHELPGLLRDHGLEEHARLIADHADEVVFPAELVRRSFEEFVGRPLPKATVRPQGLYLRSPHRSGSEREIQRRAIRQQLGLAPEARIVLGAGYADHRKGIDLFLEAGRWILAADPNTVLVWVGSDGAPSLTKAGRANLAADGSGDRFLLTGLVDNPEDFYAAADAYMLTSREDPFPSVVLEALDAELPVVAFSGTTGSEGVLVRGTGLLVPPFDTSVLATAVKSLLADPALASALGSCGRALVEEEFRFRDYLHDLAELVGNPLPRVSVVVPNYNYAGFLRDRLKSVRDQTVAPYELIVLDDASTDDSILVVEEELVRYDGRTRLVVNEQNSGSVFAQWRRGVECASGDLVWIAEADDLADPEFLAELLPAFDDPDVVMAYTQSRQIAADGAILSNDYLEYVSDLGREKWQAAYVANGEDEVANALFCKNTVPNVSAVLFRRDALLATLMEHEQAIVSFRNAGDWVTYLRLLAHGKIAFSPRPLNSHRRHDTSVTISRFDIGQLSEIVRVQHDTIERYSLGASHRAAAAAYVESLYQQFGLATDKHPTAVDHPDLAVVGNPM